MQTQASGIVLFVSAAVFALAGILFPSLPFALMCPVLLGVLIYARSKFMGEVQETELIVNRSTHDEVPFAGQPIALSVEILNAGPAPIRCVLEDVIPEDCEVAAGSNRYSGLIPARSQTTISYTLVPHKRKVYTFEGLRLEMRDEYGLFSHTSSVEDGTKIAVHTSKRSLQAARRIAGREHLEHSGKSRHLAAVMHDLEFDRLRDYLPGDRPRDIDWKLLSRLDKLFTKVYTKEGAIQTMIFVDCSRSMRTAGSGITKLDHSVDLCLQLSRVLLSSHHAAGVALIDEVTVIDQLRPSLIRHQFERIIQMLRNAPSTVPGNVHESIDTQPMADAPDGLTANGNTEEAAQMEKFLSAVRDIGVRTSKRSKGVGLDEVIWKLLTGAKDQKQMIIVISDLISSRDAVLASAKLCQKKGSQMLVLHIYDDWYERSETPLEVGEAERMYGNLLNYLDVEVKLRKMGASYVKVGPADATASIVRTIRWGKA
ncbi:MAG: DUF58 domain-containing protein [Candidatus Thermoplasmatota archaeon]|nr:DUF58 domain-containing protein [Candidatus Thermoplasmatota archaeon]